MLWVGQPMLKEKGPSYSCKTWLVVGYQPVSLWLTIIPAYTLAFCLAFRQGACRYFSGEYQAVGFRWIGVGERI